MPFTTTIMYKFILLLLSINYLSTQAWGQSGFNLIGEIKGLPSDTKLFLLKESGTIDSVVINAKSGKFAFKVDSKEPTRALLLLEGLENLGKGKNKQFQFWTDNYITTFNGNYANFGSSTVSGSSFIKDANLFDKHLSKLKSLRDRSEQLDQMYTVANSRYNATPLDKRDEQTSTQVSELAMQSVRAANLYDSTKTELVLKFMKNNPFSYVGLAEVYIRRGRIRINTLNDIYSRSKHKKLKYGQLLAQYLNEYKGVAIGQSAPEFTLEDTDGQSVTLESFRGKYVLLEFWGSWCSPCRSENPKIAELYTKYKSKGLEVLGIGMDSREKLLKAIVEDKITYRNVVVSDRYDSRIAAQYGVWAAPFNVLIDRNGKIIAIDLREISIKDGAKRLSEQLRQIFGQ